MRNLSLKSGDNGDSDDTGEGSAEEEVDLKKPGSRRNPDGSQKAAEEQLEQMEEGARKGRVFAESTVKSEQNVKTSRRDSPAGPQATRSRRMQTTSAEFRDTAGQSRCVLRVGVDEGRMPMTAKATGPEKELGRNPRSPFVLGRDAAISVLPGRRNCLWMYYRSSLQSEMTRLW